MGADRPGFVRICRAERLLSDTTVRAQQPLRLFRVSLRQDQEQEYEAEQTYGFDNSHGNDDED